MKTTYIIILAFLFLLRISNAQTLRWTTKDNVPNFYKKLICGKDSNVYVYGNNYMNILDPDEQIMSDTSGSYLEKFSPQGTLLLLKNGTVIVSIFKISFMMAASFFISQAFF